MYYRDVQILTIKSQFGPRPDAVVLDTHGLNGITLEADATKDRTWRIRDNGEYATIAEAMRAATCEMYRNILEQYGMLRSREVRSIGEGLSAINVLAHKNFHAYLVLADYVGMGRTVIAEAHPVYETKRFFEDANGIFHHNAHILFRNSGHRDMRVLRGIPKYN